MISFMIYDVLGFKKRFTSEAWMGPTVRSTSVS